MDSLEFAAFVRDAERLIDRPGAIAERLKPLLATDGWLAPEHQRGSADGYRQHLLHVSKSRRLSVAALVWLPGQRTPIHDHVSWCVVGVYRGVERETQFSEDLLVTRTLYARPGDVEVLVPPEQNIHRVESAGTEKTISIHVYGADIERLGTSILRRYDEPISSPASAAAR